MHTITSPRERAAVLTGRLAGALARRAGRGGGTALPGLVAGALAPRLLEDRAAALGHGVVLVSGTNGKTTTTHLLAAIARGSGLDIVSNTSGSNLERGLVSALIARGGRAGGPDGSSLIGLFEVDEAVLPLLAPRLSPRVVVLLNLFRDQLDRYGEVDSVAEGWRRMLAGAGRPATLVLNADDPSVALLAEEIEDEGGRVIRFGVEAPAGEGEDSAGSVAVDARFCRCGGSIRHDALLLGHLGPWRCDGCGRRRAAPELEAREVELGPGGARFELRARLPGHPRERARVELELEGLHSVYNALAAAAAAAALGISSVAAAQGLAAASPAFGRQERFCVGGREVRMLLAKNPTGLTEVIRTVTARSAPGAAPHLLIALNDGVQDGRDTSWIYDADVEALARGPGAPARVVASGLRAEDMALRLALAGVVPGRVERDLAAALDAALAAAPAGLPLTVIATYTAMLELREELARRSGRAHYWERPAEPDGEGRP
ncbi:MAG: MurT ligase domain-containing protein [Chloroflexi bacterium]|nr:MurT ligase domain-containing protein [Chloroflexota bacterium]